MDLKLKTFRDFHFGPVVLFCSRVRLRMVCALYLLRFLRRCQRRRVESVDMEKGFHVLTERTVSIQSGIVSPAVEWLSLDLLWSVESETHNTDCCSNRITRPKRNWFLYEDVDPRWHFQNSEFWGRIGVSQPTDHPHSLNTTQSDA